jgi:predicted RNA-binding protein with TRAM domain
MIDRLGSGRPAILRVAAVACSVVALTLAACAGDNLFEGNSGQSSGGIPTVTSVTAPAQSLEGRTVDVRVKAIGRRGITEITVRFRGAVNEERTIDIDPASTDTVTQDLSVAIPLAPADSVLHIDVTAKDQFGSISGVASRTVAITKAAGPVVASITAPDQVTKGQKVDLRVKLYAPRGLKTITVHFRGAVIEDRPIEITPVSSDTVVRDLSVDVPAATTDSILRIDVTGTDQFGAISEIATRIVRLANGAAPVVASVTTPATAREGQTVDVRVRAIGARGLSSVTVRFRGAINSDRVIPITPTSSDTVTIDASEVVPSPSTDSILRIDVTATDQFGGVSAIVSRTVTVVDATAPGISASLASPIVSAGRTIDLHVIANDALGLKQVGYAVVTATGDTVGGTPTLINVNGISRDTTFKIPVSTSFPPSQVSVLGIAVNASNMRGVSSPLAVQVVDSLKPVVAIIEPNEGDSYPLRDSIAVRVHVSDANGLKGVTIRGVTFGAFPDSTQNATATERFPMITIPFPQGPDRPLPTDTTIFRFLKPNSDTTSQPVYLIATATDAQNNVGVDTVRIISGPRITILTPVSGAIARVNSDLIVRMQANDPQAGLDSLKLYITGVQNDSVVFKNLGSTHDQVDRSTTIHIGGNTGQITLRAQVFNSAGVRGTTSNPPTITITNSLVTDSVAPRVQRNLVSADRIELGDSIKVKVTATDDAGSGIVRMGAVVITIPANESPSLPRDTFYLVSRTFSPPLGGTPDTTFTFRLRDAYRELGAARFPLPFTIQVQAFAIDAQGNCGASVQETMQSLPCTEIPGQSGFFVAQGQTGAVYNPTAVIGTSVRLPTGSVIADALADTLARRVYLSNFARNQVEVLNLADTTLAPVGVPVGSQPWGLFLVPGRGATDTLMVANSGGTNISFVPTNTMKEDASKRLLTANNDRLFNLTESLVNGFLRYKNEIVDFSDRPQFIAEDTNKIILYSTVPTTAAKQGTIRFALNDPSFVRPEINLIFGREAVVPADNVVAVARVDSIIIVPVTNGDDLIRIYDHHTGFPSDTFSVIGPLDSVINAMRVKGSDVFADRGKWDPAVVGFSDTTYIAYSKHLNVVGFGEGAVGPFGRITLWTASTDPAHPENGFVSSTGTTDLIGNAAERVAGLALNVDGSFGVARGGISTYFFSNNVKNEGQLRLQGRLTNDVTGGNGGVALHPDHGTIRDGSTDNTMAFIATANRTIKIYDTFHFFELGEVPIRDNVVGQLRAAPVPPAVNAGLTPTSCDFTIAQLYAVTASNSLVIVNIRKRDVLKGTGQTCTQ